MIILTDYELYGSTSAEMHKALHVVWKWLFILKWITIFHSYNRSVLNILQLVVIIENSCIGEYIKKDNKSTKQ
jgi:hypothetical protein